MYGISHYSRAWSPRYKPQRGNTISISIDYHADKRLYSVINDVNAECYRIRYYMYVCTLQPRFRLYAQYAAQSDIAIWPRLNNPITFSA